MTNKQGQLRTIECMRKDHFNVRKNIHPSAKIQYFLRLSGTSHGLTSDTATTQQQRQAIQLINRADLTYDAQFSLQPRS
ncbi:hypothetical protein [Pseudomonas sp. 3A(2025)]